MGPLVLRRKTEERTSKVSLPQYVIHRQTQTEESESRHKSSEWMQHRAVSKAGGMPT